MKISDIIVLAWDNLRRNIFRTILTTTGVAVGIGSLSSMISLGKGVSINISKQMENNDIFTGLTVSSRNIDFDGLGNKTVLFNGEKEVVPLTENTIEEILSYPEVATAFAEESKPAMISIFDKKISTNIKAIPVNMKDFYPFNKINYGSFYTLDNEPSVILSKNVLGKMGIAIEEENTNLTDLQDKTIIKADSIIGKNIEIITKVFDLDKIDLITSKQKQLPVKDDTTILKIKGIVHSSAFSAGIFSDGIFLPPATCNYIPSIDLRNVYDIINDQQGKYGKYTSVHVRVKEFSQLKTVKQRIEEKGFNVFSIGDKLEDFEKIFFLLDTVLAAIGTIALLISIFGIVNTLIMAIYERRKEIGIMKSLGATSRQIKFIFYFEAAIIGLIGGIVGVSGGKLLSQFSSRVANSQLGNFIDSNIEYFSYSWKIVFLSILFSVAICIIASIYPADKASKIDPLNALRRE